MQADMGTLAQFAPRAHLVYVFLMAATSAFGLVKTVVFAALLGPAQFGYYALALLGSSYISYVFGLGLKEGVLREGAILFGRGQMAELRMLTGQAIVLVGVVSAVLGAGVGLGLWYWLPAGEDSRRAMALAIVLSFTLVEFNLICNDLRIRQQLNAFAAALLARCVAALGAGGLFAISYGFEGVVLAEAASGALVFTAVALTVGRSFQPAVPRMTVMLPVLQLGMQLSGNNLLRNLSFNVDRWLIAFVLGTDALGQYSFALISLTVGMALVNLLGQALGPTWISQYGGGTDLSEIRASVAAVVRRVAISLLITGLVVLVVVPYFVNTFLPDFRVAGDLLPIIYVGVVFYVSNLYGWVAVTAGRGLLLLKISASVFLLLIVLDTIVVSLGWGLRGFAAAFTISRAADFLLNCYAANKLVR